MKKLILIIILCSIGLCFTAGYMGYKIANHKRFNSSAKWVPGYQRVNKYAYNGYKR